MNSDKVVSAEVWGVRLLLEPGKATISDRQQQPFSLEWPGIEGTVTKDLTRRQDLLKMVYVQDGVLSIYEGRDDFTINPKTGAVVHGTQWSVPAKRRVGRDLIAVDLKKLYEGVPEAIVREWHRYAVEPPISPDTQQANVASRTGIIVDGLLELNDLIEKIDEKAQKPSSKGFVRINRDDITNKGWWIIEDH